MAQDSKLRPGRVQDNPAMAKTMRMRSSGKGDKRTASAGLESTFNEVVALIQAARLRVARMANAEVVGLYWRIGQFLHQRIEAEGWAKGTVQRLADHIGKHAPGRFERWPGRSTAACSSVPC